MDANTNEVKTGTVAALPGLPESNEVHDTTDAKPTRKSRKATRKAKRVASKARAKTNICICGCGTKVRNLFAQGHDQRVRGMFIEAEGDVSKLPAPVRKAAEEGLILKRLHGKANQRLIAA